MAEVVETRGEVTEGPLLAAEAMAGRPRLSWGAIFAGTVSALGLWILLYVFGLAIGLSTIDVSHPGSLRPSGIFAGIWAVLVPIVALFVGGWVAGRGAGLVGRSGGGIHGLVVWGLATLAGGALVLTALSSLVGGVFTVGQEVVRAGGEAAGAMSQQPGGAAPVLGLDPGAALRPVNERLQAEGRAPVPPYAIADATKQAATTAVSQGRFDTDALAQSIATDTGLSQQDAQQVADRLGAQYQERSAQIHARASSAASSAKAGALKVVEKSGRAFWGMFATLVLTLIASVLGGAAGASVLGGLGGRKLRRERVVRRAPVVPPPAPTRPPREVYP